ncbi:hypothetical protein EV663_10228 [Rhodovulum bhavnagarense]|uniref:DnaA protein n=1 Tax=Rhodovulum bhavnagarense TaxID=992286 RepID=A0A4R2RSS1_9RHOB|nr:chromosomal replication initiator DnaA [Rhodovulum bhavnagarense]TCP62185.1 hypothetical protein EV663_10228 [Rhodovulum bhavnagarense]
MAHQLTLDLPGRPARGRSDFFVSPTNALGVAQIDDWRDWPQGKLLLIGPEGAGKTHLAHVWAEQAGAAVIEAQALAGAELPALAATGAIAVDGADRVAGVRALEEALFHLHNLTLAEGGAFLMTARIPAAGWPLILPDLASRIQGTALAQLAPPDDTLLSAVLVKLFADRQLAVPPALIPYLVERMERSFSAAQRIVAMIDHEALATGRKPGVKLAREILDKAPLADR